MRLAGGILRSDKTRESVPRLGVLSLFKWRGLKLEYGWELALYMRQT